MKYCIDFILKLQQNKLWTIAVATKCVRIAK